MITLREGDKRDVTVKVSQARGTGAWLLTAPSFRILTAARAVVVDWTAATWDSTTSELSAPFDSTLPVLAAPGFYFVQLKGTIGDEVYVAEIKVDLLEVGP
jgi:hypothetical protein